MVQQGFILQFCRLLSVLLSLEAQAMQLSAATLAARAFFCCSFFLLGRYVGLKTGMPELGQTLLLTLKQLYCSAR